MKWFLAALNAAFLVTYGMPLPLYFRDQITQKWESTSQKISNYFYNLKIIEKFGNFLFRTLFFFVPLELEDL